MVSQESRVVLPKRPRLGCWEAWMCVSVLVKVSQYGACITDNGGLRKV